MEKVRLGKYDIQITPILMGTWQAGKTMWTGIDDRETEKAIRAAFDAGITTFDTATVYGDGHSERILGKALSDVRDRVVIATKVRGPMSDAAGQGTGDVNNVGLSRKHIVEACEASLRRLGTDFIDLYQIHRWDPATPVEETMEALDSLVRAGKVRYLGKYGSPESREEYRRLLAALDATRASDFAQLLEVWRSRPSPDDLGRMQPRLQQLPAAVRETRCDSRPGPGGPSRRKGGSSPCRSPDRGSTSGC